MGIFLFFSPLPYGRGSLVGSIPIDVGCYVSKAIDNIYIVFVGGDGGSDRSVGVACDC